ncbi:MAG: hypothetical protein Q4P07_08035 [Ornithinimicrobium sp.]|uniref:hypothetical protein n=1 Tax=Ornithinimicrobium sp. TaxID=1977084 RepID=UPI0026E0B582|nr:hypothetical protein [Ornithinimicrobium sp.]MDO5740083.1 hypothetical protein [Ornithinimicrobium sp.]
MSAHRTLRRASLATAAGIASVALAAGTASAHDCYIPMYSLNGPSSPNWMVFSAQDGAVEIAGYTPECAGAVDAGYAALRAEGLPVGIKIFAKMMIGDPKETGRMNPNGANGVGLEYFGAGSSLADQMVEVWIGGAESYACSGT